MGKVKAGFHWINTRDIAMIADTYAIVNQHGKKSSSFVLTHEPANEFAKKVIAADTNAALVSTGPNGKGNFLNVDYIKDVQNHSVEMNFGTKEVDAHVPTEFTKDEMLSQMNKVSDIALYRTVGRESVAKRAGERRMPQLPSEVGLSVSDKSNDLDFGG